MTKGALSGIVGVGNIAYNASEEPLTSRVNRRTWLKQSIIRSLNFENIEQQVYSSLFADDENDWALAISSLQVPSS